MEATHFIEAINWANARGVVLPDVYYGKLQGLARSSSFSIAGVASIEQLQAVLDSLRAAMVNGMTYAQWKKLQVVQALNLPEHRLDNIFRTNILSHYARGRAEQQARQTNIRPYYLYDAVNDSRTRESHRAMDGMVAKFDDPVWLSWTPPNGYRCRCKRVSLSMRQVEDYKKRDAAALSNPEAYRQRMNALRKGPDKGWQYNIASSPTAGIEASVEASKAKADPGLQKAMDITNKYNPVGKFKYQPQATIAEAEQFAKNNGITIASYKGLDINVANAANQAMLDFKNRFGPSMSDNVAVASPESMLDIAKRAVIDNKKVIESLGVSSKEVIDSIKYTHDPESLSVLTVLPNKLLTNVIVVSDKPATEILKQLPKDFGIRSIIDKQLGNYLSNVLDMENNKDIKSIWKNGTAYITHMLSAQAATNINEMISEAWLEYVTSPAPRDLAKQIGEIIEKTYSKIFGKGYGP